MTGKPCYRLLTLIRRVITKANSSIAIDTLMHKLDGFYLETSHMKGRGSWASISMSGWSYFITKEDELIDPTKFDVTLLTRDRCSCLLEYHQQKEFTRANRGGRMYSCSNNYSTGVITFTAGSAIASNAEYIISAGTGDACTIA